MLRSWTVTETLHPGLLSRACQSWTALEYASNRMQDWVERSVGHYMCSRRDSPSKAVLAEQRKTRTGGHQRKDLNLRQGCIYLPAARERNSAFILWLLGNWTRRSTSSSQKGWTWNDWQPRLSTCLSPRGHSSRHTPPHLWGLTHALKEVIRVRWWMGSEKQSYRSDSTRVWFSSQWYI